MPTPASPLPLEVEGQSEVDTAEEHHEQGSRRAVDEAEPMNIDAQGRGLAVCNSVFQRKLPACIIYIVILLRLPFSDYLMAGYLRRESLQDALAAKCLSSLELIHRKFNEFWSFPKDNLPI